MLLVLSVVYLFWLAFRLYISHGVIASYDFGLIFFAFGFFHFGCQLLAAKWIHGFRGNPQALEIEEDVN